ncbi:MAG: YdcF family protein [Pseudomonadota bacterium]
MALMDFFFLKKILIALVLPPTGPLLIAIIGLMLLKSRPKLGRSLAWLGLLALLILSLPIVSDRLLRAVYDQGPLDFSQIGHAQAIVVLGGGVRRNAAEYAGDTVGRLTLDRVRYGALVARRTGLPILVTGGVVFSGAPEATLMKRTLEEEFQVAVRWTEAISRNTRGNAIESAKILQTAGIRSVILVGHSFDMPRALAEFAAAGLDVLPAPTHVPSGTFEGVLDLMPSLGALQSSYYALYELLANTARRLGI